MSEDYFNGRPGRTFALFVLAGSGAATTGLLLWVQQLYLQAGLFLAPATILFYLAFQTRVGMTEDA